MNNDLMKPALTYENQIDRLIKRGLLIEDKQKAASILRLTNYYRLSAYSLGLRDSNDMFHENVSIEQLYSIYTFDEKLRHLIFEVIEPIELRLRAEIAYNLGTTFGNISHLNPNLMRSKQNHLKFMATYYTGLKSSFNAECVKHNINKYGELPIWAAVENLTFGTLSKFYGNLIPEVQKPIAEAFYSDPERFPGWLESLCELRNICAHCNRLYNKKLSIKPKLYSTDDEGFSSNIWDKVFPRIIVLKKIYNGKGKWSHFYFNLSKLVSEFERDINLNHLGFPNYWRSKLDKVHPKTNYVVAIESN